MVGTRSQVADANMSNDLNEHVRALELTIADLPNKIQTAITNQFADITGAIQTAITNQFAAFTPAQKGRHHRVEDVQGNNGDYHRDPDRHCQEAEHTRLTRQIKLDFPRFQRHDIDGWLYSCERYFEIDNTPDNWKIRLASVNLDDKGYIWHQSLMDEEHNRAISWNEYKKAIKTRFGAPYESPMAELKRLCQRGSLDNYKDDFKKDSYIASVCCSPSDLKTLRVPKLRVMGSGIEAHKETKMMSNISIPSLLSSQTNRVSCDSAKKSQADRVSCDSAKKKSQANSSSCDSAKKKAIVEWKTRIISETDLAFMWVTKGQFEKSSIIARLVSSINAKIQEMTQKSEVQSENFSSQLVPIFFFADELLGFEDAYMSPITLQLGLTIPMGIINNGMLQGMFCLQCSTQKLLHTWFRGKLIAMLYGRSCPLSRKEKKGKKWLSLVQYSPTQSLLQIWFRGKLMKMLYGRSCLLSTKKKRGETLGGSSTEDQSEDKFWIQD